MSTPLTRPFATACFVLATILFAFNGANSQANAQESSTKIIKEIKSMIDKAGSLYKAKKFEESAQQIRKAQTKMIEVASGMDAKSTGKLKKDYDRLVKAQGLLEGKGESFEKIPSLDSLASQGSGTKGSGTKGGSDTKGSDTKGSSTKDGSGTKEEAMVSFVNHVAPILVKNCGQCHVQQSRGRYSMNNYDSIKKGSRKGVAVRPKNVDKSRLIQLIESGKMPPRQSGKKVSAEDLATLKTWIEQGAKFDGTKKQKKDNVTSYVSKGASQGSGSKGS